MTNQQPNYGGAGLNLRDLYQSIFGSVGLPYLGNGRPADLRQGRSYESTAPLEVAKAEDYSAGAGSTSTTREAEAFDSAAVFGTANKGARMGVYYFMPTSLDGQRLPNEPLISMQIQKRIVRTVVAGAARRGTVKELVAAEDYKISIKGIVLNESNPAAYPEREISALRKLVERRQALSIDNLLCRLMGVSRVIITGLTLNADIGYEGMQSYEMTLESDTEFDYEILKQ